LANKLIELIDYDILINCNRNCASILYHLRVTPRCLSKVANVRLRHCASVGVTPFEFCRDLRHQKTRIPELSCVILCLAVTVELLLVTDGRTKWYTR